MIDFDVQNVVKEMIQAWLKTASLTDLRAVFLSDEPDALVMKQIRDRLQLRYQQALLDANQQLQSSYSALMIQRDQQEAKEDSKEEEIGRAPLQSIPGQKFSVESSMQQAQDGIAELDKGILDYERRKADLKRRYLDVSDNLQKHATLQAHRDSLIQLAEERQRLMDAISVNKKAIDQGNQSILQQESVLAIQRQTLVGSQEQHTHDHSHQVPAAEPVNPHQHTHARQLNRLPLHPIPVTSDGHHQHSHGPLNAQEHSLQQPQLVDRIAYQERQINAIREETRGLEKKVIGMSSDLNKNEQTITRKRREILQIETTLKDKGALDARALESEYERLKLQIQEYTLKQEFAAGQRKQLTEQLGTLTTQYNYLNQRLHEMEQCASARKLRAEARAARQVADNFQQQLSPQVHQEYLQEWRKTENMLKKEYETLLRSIQNVAMVSIFKEAILADGALQPDLADVLRRSLPVIEEIKVSRQTLAGFHAGVRAELGTFQQQLEKNTRDLEQEYQAELANFNKSFAAILGTWTAVFDPLDKQVQQLRLDHQQAVKAVDAIERRQIEIPRLKTQCVAEGQQQIDKAYHSRARLRRIQLVGAVILVGGLLAVLSTLAFPLSASLLLTIGCANVALGLVLLSAASIMRGINTSRLKKANAKCDDDVNGFDAEYGRNEKALPGLRATQSECQIALQALEEQVSSEKDAKKNEAATSIAGTGFAFFEQRSNRLADKWTKTIANASELKAKIGKDESFFREVVLNKERELDGICRLGLGPT